MSSRAELNGLYIGYTASMQTISLDKTAQKNGVDPCLERWENILLKTMIKSKEGQIRNTVGLVLSLIRELNLRLKGIPWKPRTQPKSTASRSMGDALAGMLTINEYKHPPVNTHNKMAHQIFLSLVKSIK